MLVMWDSRGGLIQETRSLGLWQENLLQRPNASPAGLAKTPKAKDDLLSYMLQFLEDQGISELVSTIVYFLSVLVRSCPHLVLIIENYSNGFLDASLTWHRSLISVF